MRVMKLGLGFKGPLGFWHDQGPETPLTRHPKVIKTLSEPCFKGPQTAHKQKKDRIPHINPLIVSG